MEKQKNAVGRRKEAVMRVFLSRGEGKIVINNKDYKEYFALVYLQNQVEAPLKTIESLDKFDIKINAGGGLSKEHYNSITETETTHNLLQLINNWLERMPFFETAFWQQYKTIAFSKVLLHPFWNDYRFIYEAGLKEREVDKIKDFDYVFLEQNAARYNEEQLALLRNSFSSVALRSALFIMLYRDFPVFQTSYQILDALIEIDHHLSNWRHKHLIMVRRMIGMRVGTGNTSGSGYLEGALNRHYIYRDLSGLSTYLIERRKLPKLPEELIKHLSFNL
jgi:tryptophan 2,3-dioxygenase